MPNTNIAIIEGHLAKEPTLKEVKGGVALCSFTVATSMGKDKPTQFHSCKMFGTQAKILGENGHVGDIVSLKGRIEYRKWEDKYYTDILVEHMHLTAKKPGPAGKPPIKEEVENEFVAE